MSELEVILQKVVYGHKVNDGIYNLQLQIYYLLFCDLVLFQFILYG